MGELKYIRTQIYRSELDYTRFQGEFNGTANQEVTLYAPEMVNSETPIRCDVEIVIGGREDSLYVDVLTSSFFLPVGEDTAPSKEALRACQYTASQKAVELVAELTKMHAGREIRLDAAPPPSDEA